MYLSTMAGALEPSELAMYSALLVDSDNSEMIEFLMAGMWILLRSSENRKVCELCTSLSACMKGFPREPLESMFIPMYVHLRKGSLALKLVLVKEFKVGPHNVRVFRLSACVSCGWVGAEFLFMHVSVHLSVHVFASVCSNLCVSSTCAKRDYPCGATSALCFYDWCMSMHE